MSLSLLKETFALASSQQERHDAIRLHAVPQTDDWYYYTILASLHQLLSSLQSSGGDIPRKPTDEQSQLLGHIRALLAEYERINVKRTKELEARLNVLAYPIDIQTANAYLEREFQASPARPDLTPLPRHAGFGTTPSQELNTLASSLDPALVDPARLLKDILCGNNQNMEFEPLDALPILSHVLPERLADPMEQAMLQRLLSTVPHSSQRPDCMDTTRRLGNYLQNCSLMPVPGRTTLDSALHALDVLHNLTLEQLDTLRTMVPAVAGQPNFVIAYLNKLVPSVYAQHGSDSLGREYWDDGSDTWADYLDRILAFVRTLSDASPLEETVLFHKLRLGIVRKQYDIELLSHYCRISRAFTNQGTSVWRGMAPAPSQTLLVNSIPLLGNCPPNMDKDVLSQYLFGLAANGTPDNLIRGLWGYESLIKPLYAAVMLTLPSSHTSDAKGAKDNRTLTTSSWAEVLGTVQFKQLVDSTLLKFGYATTKQKRALKPEDVVSLELIVKNIPLITVRVFQVDMFHYWRLHPGATEIRASELRLDGLSPTWERDFEYNDCPALNVETRIFTFGKDSLAGDVFQGRGAWVIDFVGGRENCRTVVQKGRLRHAMQTTSAGHLFKILNEQNEPVGNQCKIWYNNAYYTANASGSILIPYASTESEARLLIVSDDGFCEPVEFTHKYEKYDLSGNFYINPESIIPNQKTKVVIAPKLTIHGRSVSSSLLKDLQLTVEATNIRDIKSTFTKRIEIVKTHQPIELEFTVPDALDHLSFTLHGKVDTLTNNTQQVSDTHNIIFNQLPQTNIASIHLRTKPDGHYFVQMLGKNGEPLADKIVTLSFRNAVVADLVHSQLQTDKDGCIQLGQLSGVTTVRAEYETIKKEWELYWNDTANAVLPLVVNHVENKPFKLPYVNGPGRYGSLFETGYQGDIVRDFSDKLSQKSEYLQVDGLPSGKYQLFLTLPGRNVWTVTCNILKQSAKPVVETAEPAQSNHWSNWCFGESQYAEENGVVTANPVHIVSVQADASKLAIQLGSWSSASTTVLVTTSSFISPTGTRVGDQFSKNWYMWNPVFIRASLETPVSFLSGRQLSDELQYVHHRARSEKWVGSTLNKPSLLVYPEKHSQTTTETRQPLRPEGDFVTRCAVGPMYARKGASYMRGSECPSGIFQGWTDLGFLNQRSVTVCAYPDDQGLITLDRNLLGDGNLLQVVVLSQGNQAVIKEMVLPDVSLDLKLNNLCHSAGRLDPTRPYVRSNAMITLDAGEKLTLHLGQHEWEKVASFEQLFDTLSRLCNKGTLDEFVFLKEWPTLTVDDKLKIHQTMHSHELHLWLKYKDPEFFNQHIRPSIECKLLKTFVDRVLVDEPLDDYCKDLFLYTNLSNLEKVLLAKCVPSMRSVVRNSLLDAYTPPSEKMVDACFEVILAGNALEVSPQSNMSMPMPMPMAMAMSVDTEGHFSNTFGGGFLRGENLTSSMPVPRARMMMPSEPRASEPPLPSAPGGIQEDVQIESASSVEEEDNTEEEELLREAVKRRKPKVSYKFTEPTSAWIEKGYYQGSATPAPVNPFWLDYLDDSFKNRDQFVSGNVIYVNSGLTEVLLVLALVDLPFQAEARWNQDVDLEKSTITITSHTPCLVYYRELKVSADLQPTQAKVLLNQGFFVKMHEQNMEDNMVEPHLLQPATEYGWHVAICNFSSKSCTAEVTFQIPVGSIPTGLSQYCHSRTITIGSYSTWREVVGSFYFPSAGSFSHFPVTVSQASVLIGQTPSLTLVVGDPATQGVDASGVSWTTLVSKATNEAVLSYLADQANLNSIDLSLITPRMHDKAFAAQVIDTLRKRRHYSYDIWKYALRHQLHEAIAELIQFEPSIIKSKLGLVFESPLVTVQPFETDAFQWLDYYPMIHARAHRVGTERKILNKDFYQQYDKFLDYLSQKQAPSTEDLLALIVYLILQERIKEAHTLYSHLETKQHAVSAQMQVDYLGAYLATRVLCDPEQLRLLDLSAVRAVTEKYKSCTNTFWRDRFVSLADFLDEVEQRSTQETNVTTERQQARTMLSEAIMDFKVENDKLTLQYANVGDVQIRYYRMNVEVMFSQSPFMSRQSSDGDYGWLKPNVIEYHTLPQKAEDTTEDDFDMIGLGQVKTISHTIALPKALLHANVMIEVSNQESGLRRSKAHFTHGMVVHFVESFGMVRVSSKESGRPIAGAYVKVYCRMKRQHGGRVEFWKDGYTALNGVFDYVSITEGNSLIGQGGLSTSLQGTVEQVDKFSLFIESNEYGAVVEEVFPPLA